MRTASEWAALDRQYLWHPFTQFDEWLDQPMLVVDRAEGVELIDVDGRRYLDATSSLWCNVHGHRHPRIPPQVAGAREMRLTVGAVVRIGKLLPVPLTAASP